MSLVVESGVGLENADSYISVEYADAYFNKRNSKTEWDLVTEKEKAIIDAMDYIDTAFNYKGYKVNPNQSLEFPRMINGVVEFPTRLKNAVCELALRASSSKLLADSERLTTSEKVGEIEVHYSEYSKDEVNYNFVIILIMPWLLGSGISGSLVRTY